MTRNLLPLLLTVTLLLAACTVATPAATETTGDDAVESTESADAASGDMATADCPVEPLDPPQEVTVAYVPIMKFATMYVAAERGLFEACGLDVTIERVASGTEAIAFLTEGTIDVGGIAIVTSLWNGWSQGLDLRIIAPGALEPFENSPTKLIAAADLAESGEVTEPADLAGRTVGIAGGPGSGGEYLLAKALERGDLTIRDVEIVQLGNPDMPAAFANGSIAAGILGSPYADQVIEAGDGTAIAEDLTPGLMTVAFVGSGDFVNERPASRRALCDCAGRSRAPDAGRRLPERREPRRLPHLRQLHGGGAAQRRARCLRSQRGHPG